jgi:hypothetical protein
LFWNWQNGVVQKGVFLANGGCKKIQSPGKDASMDQATIALSIVPTPFLTERLLFDLIGRSLDAMRDSVNEFLSRPPSPAAACDVENQMAKLLRNIGRTLMEWLFNNVEPDDPREMPARLDFAGEQYRCKPKSFNRCIGTLFGEVSLERFLYEPLETGESSIFPLEINLGIVGRNATAALADRVGQLSTDYSQEQLRQTLRTDHDVHWSVETLRKVIDSVGESMIPHFHAHQVEQLLVWLEQANASSGRHKVVLSVGRDGLMMPIRNEPNYKEASTATLTVYDRRGKRLGTVYLGEMPEPNQMTLSARLTALIKDVLGKWEGPMPRLCYVTDAGFQPSDYFTSVLSRMRNPRNPKQTLEWIWVVDFYHACEYIGKLAKLLFGETRQGRGWTRKMCHWLKHKPNAVFRILHSAAAHRVEKIFSEKEQENYRKAYDYLNRHKGDMNYVEYRRLGIPIGSGVTEAACKTVFTQRFKRSGMTWNRTGLGQRILDLRTIVLSGVWRSVHRSSLAAAKLAQTPTKSQTTQISFKKAA